MRLHQHWVLAVTIMYCLEMSIDRELATFCLTHPYLLSGEDQPNACQCPLTVKHILLELECTDFSDSLLIRSVSQ